ncbi:MAG TPA: hypothetical protein DCM08_13760 [Microscillaceae bacterium]|jgi:putative flippase GtrA|nr:hypothetical protein [Microscillaceae bacterium]
MTFIFQRIDQILEKFVSIPVYRQFIRFALVGFFSAAVEISSFTLLANVLKIDNLVANTISYLFTVVINYILSKAWVFESGKYSPRVEFLAFCLVAALGYVINQTVFWLVAYKLELWNVLAKVLAIGTVVMWNFFLKKFVVFKG